MTELRKVIVVGAGIGGLTTAIALQRAGWQVKVFEAAQALRTGGAGLSVMANAMAALHSIDAHVPVEQAGQVIQHFFFKKQNGDLIASMPIHEIGEQLGHPNVNIQRAILLRALAQQLTPDTLTTGLRCVSHAHRPNGVRVWFEGISKQEVLSACTGWAPEVIAAVEATPESVILKMHARDREPVEQFCDGHVVLLGDAAHPMLPSLGQGAAQAIEDAVVLAGHLARTPDLRTALAHYQACRYPRANAVVNAARFMSGIEQAESRFGCWLREWYFRLTPQSSFRKKNIDILSFKPSA